MHQSDMSTYNEVLQKCLELGCPGFLNEPVNPGQLLLTLGHVLRQNALVQQAYDATIVKEEGKAYPRFDLANVEAKMIPGLFTKLSIYEKTKELERERRAEEYKLNHVADDQRLQNRLTIDDENRRPVLYR